MKTKPIIIAIVGESESGKTTLSHHLSEFHNIPFVCSFTTRPMRPGEINGRDHWFVDMSQPIPRELLAYTFFGGHHYWTSTSQVDGLKACSYVIDEKGLLELKCTWKERYNIVPVYIVRQHKNTFQSERMKRDRERIYLPLDYYDMVIDNCSDLETFLKTASDTITSYLKLNYGLN